MDGKLGWSFFPRLGVQAAGVSLSNAPGFGKEPMVKMESAGARVRVLPLFSGRIDIDTVFAKGVTLNLARNRAGKTNWEDLAGAPPAKPAPAAAGQTKLPLAGIAVGRLDLKQVNLHWTDQTTGERIGIRELSLTTSRFESGKPFDLKLSFSLARDKAATLPVKLAARVVAEPNALKLSGLDLRLDESRITGTLEIRNFAHPALRADLDIDRFDLDRYRAPSGPAQATASSGGGDVALPVGLLRSLNLKAGLRIGDLKAFGIRVSKLDTRVSALGGQIQFGPNSATLYSGKYKGKTSLDARGRTPILNMDEKLSKVQLGPLLKDLGLFGKFTGEADLAIRLSAQGGSVNAIKRTLTGTIAVDSRNGKIDGVNLAKVIQEARKIGAKLKGKSVDVAPTSSDSTAYRTLHALLRVKNGVASNDDFKLDGDQVRATGKGSIDLVRERLDYRLQVTIAEGADRKGTTLPLSVTGSFSKLRFGVDLGASIKQEAGKKVEDKLRKLLRKRR